MRGNRRASDIELHCCIASHIVTELHCDSMRARVCVCTFSQNLAAISRELRWYGISRSYQICDRQRSTHGSATSGRMRFQFKRLIVLSYRKRVVHTSRLKRTNRQERLVFLNRRTRGSPKMRSDVLPRVTAIGTPSNRAANQV